MAVNPTHLVIFAGGKGTRLGRQGAAYPKPAIDIGGTPLVAYLIDWAILQGFQSVILAAGHLHTVLRQRLENHYKLTFSELDAHSHIADLVGPCRLIIRDTGPDAMTGERLFAVSDLLDDGSSHFSLTYGDTLTDLQMQGPLELANRHQSLICLVAGRPDARYGELVIEDERVVFFKEKKRPKFLVNRGFFTIDRKLFDLWQPTKFVSFEEDVLPYFTEKGDVVAYKSDDWFFSVDTEVDAEQLAQTLIQFRDRKR